MTKAKGTFTLTPFARSKMTTAECMMLVIIAMLPCAGFGIYSYGMHALLLMLVSTLSAVAYELVFEVVTRRKITIGDFSAAVSGLCLALILPPSVPLWFPLLGNAVGIIAAKQLFGGIGRNLLNPAAAGKLVLLIFFHSQMMNFSGGGYAADTPLMTLTGGGTIDLTQMIFGNVPGCIGTASSVCVLIGAVFLFLFGIIRMDIPLAAIITYAVFYILFGRHGLSGYYLVAQFAGGSFLFTVFFMANDFATSPVGRKARIIYGILLGVLTGIFRLAGSVENGALYALLVVNITARFLDAKLAQRPFGTKEIRRRKRIRVRRSPEEERTRREEERQKEQESSEDFENFESNVVPGGAQRSSETAGTITQEAVDLYNNRSRLRGEPFIPETPSYGQQGGTNDTSWQQEGPTGPLPSMNAGMETGPVPNINTDMGTGPLPNIQSAGPGMGTGPLPNINTDMGTGALPNLQSGSPDMGTGVIPPVDPYPGGNGQPMQPGPVYQSGNLNSGMGTGPLPNINTDMGTGTLPNLQSGSPDMGTGVIPPVDPYPGGNGQPVQQSPVYQNGNLNSGMGTGPLPNIQNAGPGMETGPLPNLQNGNPDMGTGVIPPVDPYLSSQMGQQVNTGASVPPQYGMPQQPPYMDPNMATGPLPPLGQYGFDPNQPYFGQPAMPQQPYYDQSYGYGYMPPYMQQPAQNSGIQVSNIVQGKTQEQLAAEEEKKRQEEAAEQARRDEEERRRLERIHRSPRAVEARLRRNRKKRLETSETLEEELRRKQQEREEMKAAVLADNEAEKYGDVSESLQYIDLTQDDDGELDFDAQQERNDEAPREDASVAGLMTEDIPVEEIRRRLAGQSISDESKDQGSDPYGTPAGE